MLRGGSFTGRGGAEAYGIYNADSDTTLEAEGVSALGENGSVFNNDGLYNGTGAEATLRGGSFTGRGGAEAYGIYNGPSGATLEAESVSALGENGSVNYGLYNYDATADVTQSVLEGATNSVSRASGTVTISNGRLVSVTYGTVTCVAVSQGTAFYASVCP